MVVKLSLLVQRNKGRATGWISYTLSKAERKFSRESGINAGQKFPFTYDRRHNFNIAISHEIKRQNNKKIELDATWMFYSGAWTSISTSKEPMLTPDGISFGRSIGYIEGRNNYDNSVVHIDLQILGNLERQLPSIFSSITINFNKNNNDDNLISNYKKN